MALKDENTKKASVNDDGAKEVTLGDKKYLHTSDEEWDYLVRTTDKGMKITLKFTKDEEKNKEALEGIKTFFSWL